MQRYDCSAILQAAYRLVAGRATATPTYDAILRSRSGDVTEYLVPEGVLLIEGVVALAIPELVDMASLRIFISISDEIRLQRLRTFYEDIKGIPAHEANAIIESREHEEVPFIRSTALHAEVLVDGSAI
jgi:uridine kinase